MSILKTLFTHRVTFRFLVVLGGALGLTAIAGDVSTLESLVCSILTCVD